MVPRRRQAGRGRRAARHIPQPALPSVAEIAIYGILASAVAAALLVVAGQPRSLAVAVLAGTLGLIGVLAFAAARTRRHPPEPYDAAGPARGENVTGSAQAPPGRRTSRHAGRRRRRH